jgi:hypothetical protein
MLQTRSPRIMAEMPPSLEESPRRKVGRCHKGRSIDPNREIW